MMWLSRPTSSGSGGHLSGGQRTGSSPRAAAGADRRAGPVVDAGVGHGRGDRAGRAAGRDRPVGRGDRADQAAPPRAHRRAAAGRDRRRAAGRGGLPGRAGPPARRQRRAGSWPRCPGWRATTAAGLARRLSDAQWHAVETGLGDVHAAALAALAVVAPARAAALCESVTIDLDTTDVEVYGRHKRGVAFNHQGQRVGRPHVATWADTATVLAADLLAGNEDPRRDAAGLLRRALAALPGRGAGRADPAARRRRLLRRAAGPRRPVRRHRVRHRRPADRAAVAAARRHRRGRLDRRDRHARRAGRGGRLLPELVARRDPAADPPGPPRRRRRAGVAPIRGPGGAAPCTPTSAPCRWPSWPRSTPSTATRSS